MTSQRGIIIATILAALITGAVSLYIYFNDKNDGLKVTETENPQTKTRDDKEKTLPTPHIKFAEVFVTPIDTQIPSSFYAEISNSGNEAAKDIFVSIDFGESTPEKCEVKSPGKVDSATEAGATIQRWDINELPINQSIYIVCMTNSPFFKSISVGGGNLENDKRLSYASYKAQREEKSVSFYEGLLKFILGALAAIFLFYLFLRLMRSLG